MSEFLTPEHYDAYRDAIRALGENQADGIFDANDVTKLALTIAPSAGVPWITAGDLLGVVRYFVDLGVLEELTHVPATGPARWRYLGDNTSLIAPQT